MAWSPTGIAIIDNWQAMLAGRDLYLTEEIPLYSDGRFTGELHRDKFGPHALLNPVPLDDVLGWARPAVVLRLEEYLAPLEASRMSEESNFVHYHAGGLSDEVAALLSLSTGLRVWAGPSVRTFWPGNDGKGGPRTPPRGSEPLLQARRRTPVIPGVLGPRGLDEVTVFNDLPNADLDDATALIKAARLYQQALWLSDSEPHFSWLFLVAAVEVVAARWSHGDSDPSEWLREQKPDMCDRLAELGGDAAVDVVAETLSHSMRATAKFMTFSLAYLPPAPELRPPGHAQIDWTPRGFKGVLGKLYDFRSQALHGGTPFPLPMCEPPFKHESWEAAEERPGALGVHAHGATWRPGDMPLHLHVYERVVRSSIRDWWLHRDRQEPRHTT